MFRTPRFTGDAINRRRRGEGTPPYDMTEGLR